MVGISFAAIYRICCCKFSNTFGNTKYSANFFCKIFISKSFVLRTVTLYLRFQPMKMSYAEKLKDPRWQKKRLKILERDDFTCQNCADKTKTLHVHHLKYDGEPWEIDSHYLVTLCESCHKTIDIKYEAAFKEFKDAILYQRIRPMPLGFIAAQIKNSPHDLSHHPEWSIAFVGLWEKYYKRIAPWFSKKNG